MELERRIHEFWFGVPGSPEHGNKREAWFKADDAFDTEIRASFRDDFEAAARGDLDSMADQSMGALALIILLDQFPRNMFRGTARAFATDPKALSIADANGCSNSGQRGSYTHRALAPRGQKWHPARPGTTGRQQSSRGSPCAHQQECNHGSPAGCQQAPASLIAAVS